MKENSGSLYDGLRATIRDYRDSGGNPRPVTKAADVFVSLTEEEDQIAISFEETGELRIEFLEGNLVAALYDSMSNRIEIMDLEAHLNAKWEEEFKKRKNQGETPC